MPTNKLDKGQLEMIVKRYIRKTGTYPNLNNPQTFNEKILWRKLHDRRTLLVHMTDKLRAKELTELPVIATIGKGIDYKPKKYPFIAKTNHWSGATRLIKDSDDWLKTKEYYRGLLNRKYGVDKGEWAYSQINPEVYAEQFIPGIHEIKLFCFHGRVELIRYIPPRSDYGVHPASKEVGLTYMTPDGQRINIGNGKKYTGKIEIDIPSIIENIKIPDIDHVRYDLYYNGSLYFGEYTLYSGSGHTKWSDPDFNLWLGKKWTLPIH